MCLCIMHTPVLVKKKIKRIIHKKLQNFLTTSLTFGTNTKHKVAVVQKIIKNESKTKTKSLRSDNTSEIAAPAIHVINTL